MGSSVYREIAAALARLRSGAATLSPEQYLAVLDAVEQAARALQLAPRGSDPAATGVWYHHERGLALAALADALEPGRSDGEPGTARDVTARHAEELDSDLAVIRALQASLERSRASAAGRGAPRRRPTARPVTNGRARGR